MELEREPADTVGIIFTGTINNIILHYNDVDISIALDRKQLSADANVVELEVISIMLFHKRVGDITNLYSFSKYDRDGDAINIPSGDELVDELQMIFVFIDNLNGFCRKYKDSYYEKED